MKNNKTETKKTEGLSKELSMYMGLPGGGMSCHNIPVINGQGVYIDHPITTDEPKLVKFETNREYVHNLTLGKMGNGRGFKIGE